MVVSGVYPEDWVLMAMMTALFNIGAVAVLTAGPCRLKRFCADSGLYLSEPEFWSGQLCFASFVTQGFHDSIGRTLSMILVAELIEGMDSIRLWNMLW